MYRGVNKSQFIRMTSHTDQSSRDKIFNLRGHLFTYPPLTPWNKKTVMYNSQHDHIAGRDMPTFIIHGCFADMQSPFFLHFLLSFSLGKQLKWVWTHKEGERDIIFYFIRFYVAHSLFINMTHGQSNVPVMPIKLCWHKKRDRHKIGSPGLRFTGG